MRSFAAVCEDALVPVLDVLVRFRYKMFLSMTNAHPARQVRALTFKLEDELRDALERLAEKNDRSLSAEIRRALKKHVTAEKKAA